MSQSAPLAPLEDARVRLELAARQAEALHRVARAPDRAAAGAAWLVLLGVAALVGAALLHQGGVRDALDQAASITDNTRIDVARSVAQGAVEHVANSVVPMLVVSVLGGALLAAGAVRWLGRSGARGALAVIPWQIAADIADIAGRLDMLDRGLPARAEFAQQVTALQEKMAAIAKTLGLP